MTRSPAAPVSHVVNSVHFDSADPVSASHRPSHQVRRFVTAVVSAARADAMAAAAQAARSSPKVTTAARSLSGSPWNQTTMLLMPSATASPARVIIAENASPAQRDRLDHLGRELRRLGESGELETFLVVDIEFHALILEASGNDMFCALREVITEVLTGRTHQGLMPHNPREHALRTHEQAAFAIRDGDAATAEACMASLLAEVSSAVG